jgi:phenylalanyl-tRNA synthetase beta chain
VLGIFGELAPEGARAMDVKGPAMAFTLFPAEIPMPKDTSASRGAVTMPEFQAVDRDFAFVVDAAWRRPRWSMPRRGRTSP